ncbi:MAG: hypothetical protein APF80_00535 [Alphaproteobacteria bacterium BRH_c36]|nr:MAG: hypothetical protein APF80_00535 [Alphaproteobacteria bacterium BRH_c36]
MAGSRQPEPRKEITTVHSTRKALIAAAAIAAQIGIVATAHAQTTCQWYAATALKQQQDNEHLKCGFEGVAWHADLGRHLEWCKGVAPDEWKAAAQERDKQLAQCAKR